MDSCDIAFTHMGLFVTDCARMADFYCNVLGFSVTDRGQIGAAEFVFLSRNPEEHHQIVLTSGRAAGSASTVQQISFHTPNLAALKAFYQRAVALDVSGVTPLAHGNAWSVYFADPDGNRLEVYTETPWYVSQPYRGALDLTASDEEILTVTEELCRTLPNFKPRSEWLAEMTQRMARV
jgi:catechol-2,3-dioxygenase